MIKGGKVPMSKTIISGENTDIFITKRKSFHFVLVMESQNCRLRDRRNFRDLVQTPTLCLQEETWTKN